VKIAFTSCSHPRKHPSQPVWLQVLALDPDVLLLMGDNVYVEDHWWNVWVGKPARKLADDGFASHLHARYRMQWKVPQFQALLHHLHQKGAPILGTVDDHDFLGNDLCVAPETQTKARIARVLHRQFIACCNQPLIASYPAVPAWQAPAADAGFDVGLGLASHWVYPAHDLSLTVLDNRSYRQKVDKANPHRARVLGQAQLTWLQTCLQSETALHLVFSGSPLTDGTKRWARGSPLQDYPSEYQQVCEIYRAQPQPQRCIVHIGGDLHYNDFKLRDAHNPCINLTSSGMGSGWQPFARSANGNHGLIEWANGQLRIRTFGNESARNIDYARSLSA
jgi:alkaline phosphatase D